MPKDDSPPPLPEPLAGTVFDSHCHFDSMSTRLGLTERGEPAGAEFVAEAMRQAAAVGITRVVNVGCEVEEWQPTLDSTGHPDVYAALAVHPTAVGGLTDAHYAELERLLAHPKVVAVGETGLDYYWPRVIAESRDRQGGDPPGGGMVRSTEPALQQEHFRRHIELARRVHKPLMIHDRDAHTDILDILAETPALPAGVIFHAFSGDAEMAQECVRRGYLLSFPGVLTFKNAPKLRAAAEATPLESILVETDAPFLTAHPYRGRPNAPYLIPHVVRQLSVLKGVEESVVCATVTANGQRVFGW